MVSFASPRSSSTSGVRRHARNQAEASAGSRFGCERIFGIHTCAGSEYTAQYAKDAATRGPWPTKARLSRLQRTTTRRDIVAVMSLFARSRDWGRRASGRALELANAELWRDAVSFARRYRVSPAVYPHARRANLDMLPRGVDPRDGLILDIGANEGDWTRHVLRVFPDAEIIAAEPGPEPRARLEHRFGEAPNVTIDTRAISDSAGFATYHRTRASVFASLLAPTAALHGLYALPGSPTERLETLEVSTATLDELVGDRAVSLLKLDVQGGELAVLRGGAKTLRRTAAVLIEVLFQGHYEGDATFPGLHEAMVDLGFVLIDLGRPHRFADGPALWADACYAQQSTVG
jgi:FkbM family methyltransferase